MLAGVVCSCSTPFPQLESAIVIPREIISQCVPLYTSGKGSSAIAALLGIAKITVLTELRRAGVTVRQGSAAHRRLAVDEGAFDTVTPESAYWIGLFMADGSVVFGKKNSVSIVLSLNDPDGAHVATFRDFLRSGHSIVRVPPRIQNGPRGQRINTGETFRLTVWSKRLADALGRFGVIPNKTERARAIGLESDRDFWRGVADGDGTVSIHNVSGGGYVYRRPYFQLLGSHGLLEQFSAFARSVEPRWRAIIESDTGTWKVRVTGDVAASIIRALYQDCGQALPRKHEAAGLALVLDGEIKAGREARRLKPALPGAAPA